MAVIQTCRQPMFVGGSYHAWINHKYLFKIWDKPTSGAAHGRGSCWGWAGRGLFF